MKFKGTKGKWTICKKNSLLETDIESDTYRIAEVKHYNAKISNKIDPTQEEGKYNALLISKAPEILEMLELLTNYYSADNIEKAKKLIEEATE